MKILSKAALFLSFIFCVSNLNAQTASAVKSKVFYFKLNAEINAASARTVDNALSEAEKIHADYIVMELNTFGGELDAADHIRKKILDAKPIMLVYINDNAASAGALISIACDSIYMHSGAKFGSASVVNQNGEIMPDKYQSYMRALMRSTASVNHRDSMIAEGMVTANNYLPSIAGDGEIIAFTPSEAIQNKYCNAEANSLKEVFQKANIHDYELTEYKASWIEGIIGWLMNPAVSSVLLLIILAGIYFEFQHPGIGLPLFASIIGSALYFGPLYLNGLAANWEILVFAAGIILLALEIFVIPGFGVAGISGIICIVMGLTLALVKNNNFNFDGINLNIVTWALIRVMIMLVAAVILGIYFGGNIFNSKAGKRMVLSEAQDKSAGYSSPSFETKNLTGKNGFTTTDCNPSGYVLIDDEKFDCVGDGKFIQQGTRVVVVEVKGNYLVVRKVESV